jgi:hypothetical protein
VIPRSGYLIWGSSSTSDSAATAANDISEAEVSKAAGNVTAAVVADSACRIGGPAADPAVDAMEKGLGPYA